MAERLVSGLPLRCDAVESQKVNEFLVKRLEAQDAALLGPAHCHLPKLVEAFVAVLGRGTELAEEGTALRMAGLLHSMGPGCPGLVDAAFAQLKDKQKANFTAFMAGQVPK
eukprot:GHRQ01022586.1.p3 GENE.GHRQ01022586.1~~GHRQ01022586.1.p3  ORF type:complete len:111 (+),score=52.68 GHRQ01022586.1:543-875(+)